MYNRFLHKNGKRKNIINIGSRLIDFTTINPELSTKNKIEYRDKKNSHGFLN